MGTYSLELWKHKSWILFSLLIRHKFIHNSLCISCTNTMDESSSRKTACFSASQEISHNFWNPNVYIHDHTPHHRTLFWAICIQATHSHPISLWSIIGLSSHLHLDLLSGLFASGFCVPKLCMQFSAPPPICCSSYTTLKQNSVLFTWSLHRLIYDMFHIQSL